ncbi:MAG: hypothetical protein H6911_02890 [Rickettsiaceae bacterium]|nr:hypothetical protein [Rickettsiaceae bacterium]
MNTVKPFKITDMGKHNKMLELNKDATGIDQESAKDSELNLKDNLYNYFPPTVKAVPNFQEIKKFTHTWSVHS